MHVGHPHAGRTFTSACGLHRLRRAKRILVHAELYDVRAKFAPDFLSRIAGFVIWNTLDMSWNSMDKTHFFQGNSAPVASGWAAGVLLSEKADQSIDAEV